MSQAHSVRPTVIVLANGPEDKWGGYLGVARHFVEVDGERVIDRTVRQFGANADVIVSGPDPRYRIPGCALFTPAPGPTFRDADILLETRPLWSAEGRTVILLGDTWFSDAAARTILDLEAREWTYFGRALGSRWSETDYGEIFGLSFWPENIAEGAAAACEIDRRQRDEGLWRAGMWEHYRLMNGIDPLIELIGERFVDIDDETDDIDFAWQYETWIRNRRDGTPLARPLGQLGGAAGPPPL